MSLSDDYCSRLHHTDCVHLEGELELSREGVLGHFQDVFLVDKEEQASKVLLLNEGLDFFTLEISAEVQVGMLVALIETGDYFLIGKEVVFEEFSSLEKEFPKQLLFGMARQKLEQEIEVSIDVLLQHQALSPHQYSGYLLSVDAVDQFQTLGEALKGFLDGDLGGENEEDLIGVRNEGLNVRFAQIEEELPFERALQERERGMSLSQIYSLKLIEGVGLNFVGENIAEIPDREIEKNEL